MYSVVSQVSKKYLFQKQCMMHDYNLLVCLFICVCIAIIIMAVVCEYFICPTVGPLDVHPYLYYYTIKLNISFF